MLVLFLTWFASGRSDAAIRPFPLQLLLRRMITSSNKDAKQEPLQVFSSNFSLPA
jgi:hypothetical protein